MLIDGAWRPAVRRRVEKSSPPPDSLDDLGKRPDPPRDHRGPLPEGLDQHDAERLEAHRRHDQRERVRVVAARRSSASIRPRNWTFGSARGERAQRRAVLAVARDEQVGARGTPRRRESRRRAP